VPYLSKKDKIKIFVAFSYDSQDKPLTDKIINFISKEEFGFEPYIVGQHRDVSFLDEQIQKNIHESDGIFAIFTKRYTAEGPNKEHSLLPPPMVISESSFAMGRHYGLHKKAYAGMFETGIEPQSRDLGLIVMRPLRLIPFDREKILHERGYLREILEDYLKDFKQKIVEESEKQSPPYIQNTIDKTIYLYNNGTAISEIHSRVVIVNATDFDGIDHLIYLNAPNKNLPSFDKMLKESPSEKPDKHFFSALIKKFNNKEINIPFEVIEKPGRSNKKIPLTLKLPFDKLSVKDVRPNDVIEYEYAWGYPHLFRTKIATTKEPKYDEIRLQSTYGRLDNIGLKLVVEKGFNFSKKPFLSKSLSLNDSASFDRELKFNKIDVSIIYDTYSYYEDNFFGTIRVQWTPE